MTSPQDPPRPQCPVCRVPLHPHGDGTVLGHIPVTYRRCPQCGMVLLPSPGWLDEAYSDAISSLDVGLLNRCQQLAETTTKFIRSERIDDGEFLDWAGGYGTLTRLMRDRGYQFRHHDPYCKNLFAGGLEGGLDRRYQLVTAFEVVEHLPDPVEALRPLSDVTDRILFTTYLLPDPPPLPGEWWYYAPESGQHVTFHTVRSLDKLGKQLGYKLISDGTSLHMFHRGSPRIRTRLWLAPTPRRVVAKLRRLQQLVRVRLFRWKPSLTDDDFDAAARRANLR